MRLRVIPPKRLDIGWNDLALASLVCVLPHRREALERRIEARWGDAIVCLSARSGLDLLLRALSLPPGSEVLVSAITIPDVARILRHHGLLPVPVDVDLRTLMPPLERLEEARSRDTRAVLVAHLFGARGKLDPIAAFARDHDLFLIEDAAQAFEGPNAPRSAADATMLSFGPIKTATSLGGGVILVRDRALRQRMRALQEATPVQRRPEFAARVARSLRLRALTSPVVFGSTVRLLTFAGVDVDRLLGRSSRSFQGHDLIPAIRRRPCTPLLVLLDRRLRRFDPMALLARERLGRRILAALPAGIAWPGKQVERHTFWLLPVLVPDPPAAERALRRAGFYAMRGTTRLGLIEGPRSGRRDGLHQARRLLAGVVYLPNHGRVRPETLGRILTPLAPAAPPVATTPRARS